MDNNKNIIEEAEDVVVEIVKAPFKVVGKLFDWFSGFNDDD